MKKNRPVSTVLKPAVYSKAQRTAQIVSKILAYPEQICNTPQAFKGLVIEFIENDGPDYGQPVGSLPEFYDVTHSDSFMIKTRSGGAVRVIRQPDGKFVVNKIIPEKSPT